MLPALNNAGLDMSDSNETLAENLVSARMKISPRPLYDEGGALDNPKVPPPIQGKAGVWKRDKAKDRGGAGFRTDERGRMDKWTDPQADQQGAGKEERVGKQASKRRHWTPEEVRIYRGFCTIRLLTGSR